MINTYKKLAGIFAVLLALAVTSCDNNVGGSAANTPSKADFQVSSEELDTQTVDMATQWSLDGSPIEIGYNLYDMAWHLLTVTVVDMDKPLESAIAVNGLLYQIYPAPKDNRGEKLEVEDINCKTAMFSKNGDSCSVYVRISYDTATGTSNPPTIPAQFITGAKALDAFVTIYDKPVSDYPQADYRVVSPIESRYYQGTSLAGNPIQYQILSMQNVGTIPLTITKLIDVTNTTFTLKHRVSAESSDQYYGGYAECSLQANDGLHQVSILPTIGSECVLVYEAAQASTQALQTDNITLETTAKTTAPWTNNTLKLVANYATATQIPTQITDGAKFLVSSGSAVPSGISMVMNSDGTLSSGEIIPSTDAFSAVNLSYSYVPRNIPVAYEKPYYENGMLYVADQSDITPGVQLVTNASSTNPVTVGGVTPYLTSSPNASYVNNEAGCSNGTIFYRSNGTITANMEQVRRGVVHFHAYTTIGSSDNTSDIDMPMSGYSGAVFSLDDHKYTAVSGSIDGSCDTNMCYYTMHTSVYHNGGDSCSYGPYQRTFPMNFPRPYVNMQLSQLGNFTLQNPNPSIMSKFTQSLSATIGSAVSSPVVQAIMCPLNANYCSASGLYSNGLSGTNMSYSVGLSAGDTLIQGVVDFTRSEGYTLSNFTAIH